MISIVTGTLNRVSLLSKLIDKLLNHIKVCYINVDKKAYMTENDFKINVKNYEEYKKGFINNSIKFLL